MTALLDVGWFALGGVAGLAHFHLLRWNTQLFIAGSAWRAVGMQVLRLAAISGVLILVALQGAWPLLFTALGVVIARFVVTRSTRPPRAISPDAEATSP
jgi:F1F0 ATPase subunit 2